MLHFFRGLRGKLTLTYTLVTVLALLALEVLVLLGIVVVSSLFNADKNAYFGDVVFTLSPQASQYLQPGAEDRVGLQAWLEKVYASGKASLDPQNFMDSPAAAIVPSDGMYVLSPEGVVLAQAPAGKTNLIGRSYTPTKFPNSDLILERALSANFNPLSLVAATPQRNYLMAVPIAKKIHDEQVLGVIILTLEPPPPLLLTIWPVLLSGVLITGLLLLIGVAPFGTLFGFIMSRGLTRRLRRLTAAADAWSEGDFSLLPQDSAQDEISYLARRMRNMAEHIQSLLNTQQELALMEERNRLARDLHDTVKQQTFATLMQVRAARNLLQSDPAAADKSLQEAEGLIKRAQQDLGLIIAEARPAALEGQGLARALQKYVETWSQHAHIPARFQVQNERALPLQAEQAFYRVAQEALSNAARHSRASSVEVRLEYTGDQVRMVVADNGVGFASQTGQELGYGLRSMQERMEALGGSLWIASSSENGTRITATAPCAERSG